MQPKTADILPFGPPKDYPEGVRRIRRSRLARVNGEAPDLIEELQRRERAYEPSFGERLVRLFRLHGEAISFWFGISAVVLALSVVVAAYVGAAR